MAAEAVGDSGIVAVVAATAVVGLVATVVVAARRVVAGNGVADWQSWEETAVVSVVDLVEAVDESEQVKNWDFRAVVECFVAQGIQHLAVVAAAETAV